MAGSVDLLLPDGADASTAGLASCSGLPGVTPTCNFAAFGSLQGYSGGAGSLNPASLGLDPAVLPFASFLSVTAQPPACPPNQPPQQSPDVKAEVVGQSIAVVWNAVPCATEYGVAVDLPRGLIRTATQATFFSAPGESGTSFVAVTPRNAAGAGPTASTIVRIP